MSEQNTEQGRITAREFLLANWSRFQCEQFRLSGSTLITGVNGTGKSTILDAMTYLLTGNTRFNLAAGDRDRTVKAYVRGDTRSNGSDRYLRTGSVVSYIAMELWNPAERQPLVIGVEIESPNELDRAVPKWFVLPDTELQDIHLCERDKERNTITILPRQQMLVRGSRMKSDQFMDKTRGVAQILRALGLRVDPKRYESKLTKMMAFDPENNIDLFIQNNVLDEDPVDSLKEIKEYRQRYLEVKQTYDGMLAARQQLEAEEKAAAQYEERLRFVRIRELLLAYQALVAAKEEKENIQIRIRALTEKEKVEKKKQEGLLRQYESAQERLTAAQNNDLLKNIRGTLTELKRDLQDLEREIRQYNADIESLRSLSAAVQETQTWGEWSLPLSPENLSVLTDPDGDRRDGGSRMEAFLSFSAERDKLNDRLGAEKVHLADQITEQKNALQELYAQRSRLEANTMLYDERAEQARKLVQKKLQEKGIKTDVFLFAELVKSLKDEHWRNAIETFLGRKRFYLVVDPSYCGDVLEIIRDNGIYDIHAVVTDRLPDDLLTTKPGSAASQLDITNRSARKFANYLLNGIWLCRDLGELHDHPLGGLTADGMLAKSYAVSHMDIRKTRPCLGGEALRLQKKVVETQIRKTEETITALQNREAPVEQHLKILSLIRRDPQDYNFDAPAQKKEAGTRAQELKEQIHTYETSPDFMAALQEQQAAQEAVRRADQQRMDNARAIAGLEEGIHAEEEKERQNREDVSQAEAEYREQCGRHPELEVPMQEEYGRMREHAQGAAVITSKYVMDLQTELQNKYQKTLEQAQVEYLKITGNMDWTRVGPVRIPEYRAEYQTLRNVRMDEARQKLEEKSEQLEQAFMNDFVAGLKEKMDQAREELDGINGELRRMPFGSDTYRFEMKPRADRKAFFDIVELLNQYMGQTEMMMAAEQGNSRLDHDIEEFMNVILSDEDEGEYTDYRRYFTYDMTITSRQGEKDVEADLSAKQGSASGGEKQTPYFIILAASLLQCYPRESCCARLAFIDEAFSALSRERIEQMVRYLEENHFQVIYAAPPEKIDSIGSLVGTTVSLLQRGRYTFPVEGLAQ